MKHLTNCDTKKALIPICMNNYHFGMSGMCLSFQCDLILPKSVFVFFFFAWLQFLLNDHQLSYTHTHITHESRRIDYINILRQI
jgi:hypothetical protein